LAYSSPPTMEAVLCSKMPVNFYLCRRRYIPEDCILHSFMLWDSSPKNFCRKIQRSGLKLEKQNTIGQTRRELRPHQHAFICMQHVHITQIFSYQFGYADAKQQRAGFWCL
jgi:hypothetical protein